MHVRAAVLCVAERFADDAANAQRRAEAMGYGRSLRGQVATRAEGAGDEGSTSSRSVYGVVASRHQWARARAIAKPGGGSERVPTASEALTKYSQSTQQGTRVGKGGGRQRVPADSSDHCGGGATTARPIAAAHIQPTHKRTHTHAACCEEPPPSAAPSPSSVCARLERDRTVWPTRQGPRRIAHDRKG